MTQPADQNVKPTVALDPAQLIEDGQGLVRSIALKVFRGLPVPTDLDDLIAYGQLGLVEAAQSFDPTTGTKFTTFAYYRVRGAIYDGVSKMAWTSRARIRRLRFQAMADDVLENEHSEYQGGDGSVQDDATWLGRVTERLAVVYLATSDDDAISRSIKDAADPHESPSVSLASRELQQKLPALVDQLDSQARRLITGIYFDGFSLTQAAERAGISKSWASRIHAKSLDKLAKSLRDLSA